MKDKKDLRVRDRFHYTEECSGVHSIGNSKCSVPKKTPIVFHNGFNCDYYFIIKGLAKEL